MKNKLHLLSIIIAVLFVSGCEPDKLVFDIFSSDLYKAANDEVVEIPMTVTFQTTSNEDGVLTKAAEVAKKYLGDNAEYKISKGDFGNILVINCKIPMGKVDKLKNYLTENKRPFAFLFDNSKITLETTYHLEGLNFDLKTVSQEIYIYLSAGSISLPAKNSIVRIIGDTEDTIQVQALAVFVGEKAELTLSKKIAKREVLEIEYRGGSESVYSQILPQFSVILSDNPQNNLSDNSATPNQQSSDDISFFAVDVPQDVKDVFKESKRLNSLREQLNISIAELSKMYQPTNEKIVSKQNEIEKVKSDLEQLLPNIQKAAQEWLKILDEKISIKEQEYAEIIKEYLPTSQQAKTISQEISRFNAVRKRAEISLFQSTTAFTVQENSFGMKLIYIPAGEFMMGSNAGNDDEKPVHNVVITKGFYMGQFEVTQSQYEAVMGKNPSYSKGDNLPVENVSWNDAMEFCKELSEKEGKKYTLPTEAQWEYACRAGTTTRYSFGESESYLGDYAWYYSNSGTTTHPVGTKTPNPWDLYDMHGNVWEWCLDWYDSGYYAKSDKQDPVDLQSSGYRVVRGGGWSINPSYCRSAYRHWVNPGSTDSPNGFRVVCVP